VGPCDVRVDLYVNRDLLPEPLPIEERLSNARWFQESRTYDGTPIMIHVRDLIEAGEAVYSGSCVQMTRLGYDRASERSLN
jgi:hypothetical protein